MWGAIREGADRLQAVAGFLKIADVELVAGVDPVGPKSRAVAQVQVDGVTRARGFAKELAGVPDGAGAVEVGDRGGNCCLP